MIGMNLRKFYCILAVISTLAAIQSMMFPRWPNASKISSEKLNRFRSNVLSEGHAMTASTIEANYAYYNISHSPIIHFNIGSNADLSLTNVQVRDRNNFSISYITESVKSLRLKTSASKSKQPPFFLSETSIAGTNFQTCFVPVNSLPANFGVNQVQLSLAADHVESLEEYLGIKRFLGLSPSRHYQCMLITLKTTLPSQESYQLWHDLLNQLQLSFK